MGVGTGPYWEDFFKKQGEWIHNIAKDIEGDVLSIGSGDDLNQLGGLFRDYFEKSNSYTTSDIRQYRRFCKNMILDVRDMSSISDGRYNAIFCCGTIEHIDDFHKALSEMTRVLCKGGTLLISFPFNTQFHCIPRDYWRFTKSAVYYLLDKDYMIKDIMELAAERPDPLFPHTHWVYAIKK